MKRLSIVLIAITLFIASCSKGPKTDTAAVATDTTVYRVKTMLLEKQKVARKIDYTASLLAL